MGIFLYVFLYQEVKSLGTLEEFEAFMLLHGERIIDALGAEVDRIEKEIKVNRFIHCTILFYIYSPFLYL